MPNTSSYEKREDWTPRQVEKLLEVAKLSQIRELSRVSESAPTPVSTSESAKVEGKEPEKADKDSSKIQARHEASAVPDKHSDGARGPQEGALFSQKNTKDLEDLRKKHEDYKQKITNLDEKIKKTQEDVKREERLQKKYYEKNKGFLASAAYYAKKIGDVTKKKLLGVTPKDPLSVARLTLESQEEKMEKYARKVDDLAKEIGELTLKGLGKKEETSQLKPKEESGPKGDDDKKNPKKSAS